MLTSALPVSRSSLAMSTCPFSAAPKSGVRPYSSLRLTSALPVSRSSLAMSTCPFSAAHKSV
ncbi:hypothetical protein BKA60DRAFT_549865 [Fusarium oxysporum]|nr:hypothetical protein BKA60DRAFT_549865 [Fusarium oxysporum]